MVIGFDGQEYGPADIPTLRQWVQEGRINTLSKLRDFTTGRVVEAGSIPELFPSSTPPPPVGAAYARPGAPMGYQQAENPALLYRTLGYSLGGVVLFFVLHGIGLIFSGYGLYYAFQLKSSGSKYGVPVLVLSGICFAAVALGWVLRMSHVRS